MKKLLGIVVLGLLWCNVGFADDPSERCGAELTAKLEGYMVWLTEELPHIEPAINLNCKIQIMNLKELTEEDRKS